VKMKLMPFAQLLLTNRLDIMMAEIAQFYSCGSLNKNERMIPLQ
jgi:hypothetical protein